MRVAEHSKKNSVLNHKKMHRHCGAVRTCMKKLYSKLLSKQLRDIIWLLRSVRYFVRGSRFAQGLKPFHIQTGKEITNPLRKYFLSRKSGHGIMKWDHYFDIYHHHFSTFIGKQVHILEIGVHSGGSLEMWRDYFGPHCRVYGADIQESCKKFEDRQIEVFIGNQGDKNFWKSFKEHVPKLDIVIDDGSHIADDQIIYLEELLPHMRPGGVYVCEDVRGDRNTFALYVNAFSNNLHISVPNKIEHGAIPTPLQKAIGSVHTYPFVVVIEKQDEDRKLKSMTSGDTWEVFSNYKHR